MPTIPAALTLPGHEEPPSGVFGPDSGIREPEPAPEPQEAEQ